MKLVRAVLVALVTLVATTAAAQSSALAGKWDIEYQRGVRNENGEVTAEMGKATLTLEQRGDSLVGEFVPFTPDGKPGTKKTAFAAKASGASAVFVTTAEARLNMNGEERTVKSILTWSLAANGDTLTGSMKRELDGFDMPNAASEVRGTRAK